MAKGRTKGVRWIDGREYLLCGRADSKEGAQSQARALRASWFSVRIVKLWEFDFMLYVHGRR